MSIEPKPGNLAEAGVRGFPTSLVAAFLAATFLSAALIFAIQPMFARFVLPRLGGSPGVWSVAMAFFQALLFCGYLYAHLLTRLRSWPARVATHLTVSAVALLWLPLGIARGWGDPPASGEALWLLGLFAASIGAPYFALSANGPLLQSWFARGADRPGADPYFLYAVSNAGSFLALLAYPLMIEPLLPLAGQSMLWSVGYVVLVALLAICGVLVLKRSGSLEHQAVALTQAPPLSDLLRWCLLGAIPSGLLVAVTAQISTDIAAIPLVWVIPLALYLLTLVIVFRSWGEVTHRRVVASVPWLLLAVAGVMVLAPESNLEGVRFFAELLLHLSVFVGVAFMCHGELARGRPHASHLTMFYLAMAFGGMIGGAFASLAAPALFSWIAEYPILIVAAALCRPAGTGPEWSRDTRVRVAVAAAAVVVLGPGLLGRGAIYQTEYMTTAIGLIGLAAAAMAWRSVPLFAAALAVLLATGRLYPPEGSTTVTFRSFFGVHKVHDSDDGQYRLLQHGTTTHGAQRIRDEAGKQVTGRPEPLTYYFRGSPISEVLDAARARKGAPLKIAAVGLGAGSMTCLVDPADELGFFEIDPTVIAIARNPRYFTFISGCRPDVPVVVGDARITLGRAAPAAYDVIVIDAFASDSVPAHLLTREAMALYAGKLAPGGLIALHLSNRHMELMSVAHSVARSAGFASLGKDDDLPEEAVDRYRFDSTVAVVARTKADLAGLAQRKNWEVPDESELAVRPWTDDYANPLGAIWRNLIP